MGRRVSFGIKKLQRRTSTLKCQSLLRDEADKMNNASPTILRTRHKFGDYLSQPDIAKFELPKKMSRPWIVNNAYEQEKLKELIVTEAPVEATQVMLQIKEGKAERRKHVGYNKKHGRNINEIIEKDHKTVKDSKKKVSTEEDLKKRKHMSKRRGEAGGSTQDDAIHAPTNVVESPHVSGKEEDEQKERAAGRDIEMEQQQMMNRVFNCPNLYSASGPFTTMVQMVPVVVPNQNGGFFVVQLPVQPLPQNIFQPSPFSCSSTCSSVSPPASDDGFVDGSDESADETESLVEMVEDKLAISQDLCMEEESDNEINYEILDEDLERVVRSIIDEDD